MPAFILELGVEELPARFLADAEAELTKRLTAALQAHSLPYKDVFHASTPRRLAVFISEVASQTEYKEEVIIGPPLKAAYDVGGRPTRAAEGFAKTHGVQLEDTFSHETDKGPYLAVKKASGGEAAASVLARLCTEIISGLSFPKKMRWGNYDFSFARPLRWIVCLLGADIVPIKVSAVESNRQTYGHREYGAGPFPVAQANEYFSVIEKQCGIVLENEKRLAIIRQEGTRLAIAKNGVVLWKEHLLHEVQGLCERPVPILGSFSPDFLEIPREVLLTSMESHQKSFGLETNDGRLLPYFLTVLNIVPDDMALVQTGWERVLRARLEDARFFWKTDLHTGFDAWLNQLDSVIFLAPLGSMGDKSQRISVCAQWLATEVAATDGAQHVDPAHAARAGKLSKADLVSEMVKEFDSLQGVMGGIYAEKAGEDPIIAKAIKEHYLPAGPDSPLPESLCGALVSIADKADTLTGCFGLGMIPSGTADPYGLRRAVLGIVRIAHESGLRFSLSQLLHTAQRSYKETIEWKLSHDQALARLQEFIAQRIKHYFIAAGHDVLLVEACLQAGFDDVWALAKRIVALEKLSKQPAFENIVLTYKRLANITRKQQQEGMILSGVYSATLFTETAEKILAEQFEEQSAQFDQLWLADDYDALFGLIAQLQPVIDAFFTSVMVMCEDEEQRNNRLNLLAAIVERFARLADFSALQM